jgi:hypothetical protein
MDQNSFGSQGSGDNYSGDDMFKNIGGRQGNERRTAVASRGATKKDTGSLE